MNRKIALIGGFLVVKKIVVIAVLAMLVGSSEAQPALKLPPPPAPVPASGFQTFGTGLPLAEFLKIALGELSGRPYVLAPEVAASSQLVAADLTKSKLKDPLPLVRAVIEPLGLEIRDLGGVLLVDKRRTEASKKSPGDTFTYRPRHRSVNSLSTYFNMFPELAFSYSGGLAVRAQTVSSSDSTEPGKALQPTMSSGATTFSAQDKDPSFLVVAGDAAEISRFKTLIVELDVPVPQVLVKAYVFEVRTTDARDGGVKLVADLLGGRVGFNLGGASSSTTPDALRLTLPNVSLAVSALAADSRVRLVSSPVLRVDDSTTASATVGTSTPTLGAIVSQNGSTQQSVSYQEAGVLLSVSARVLEASIRLTISQELSSFVKTDTGLSNTPTKLRRAFKSDVVARDGEALLLGGLTEAQTSDAKQTSFFGFGSASKSTSSSEVVVLLTATRLDQQQ
ncbi:hypothetical protein [Roseateles asaccharophilus]|uniref:Type II secretory pathway component GspD/PulD (Secretin) n=1 Tax=Roseateles asaccharophilus TaxID=582607 RepID=A0ABU2AAQ4_9BURK|nr:hypothetical protein [Roseateles asaccharophilus]MDR7334283.1 type II secretory pathway component GspD/PulD (secretin) [Roseateles asaccharophilus]